MKALVLRTPPATPERGTSAGETCAEANVASAKCRKGNSENIDLSNGRAREQLERVLHSTRICSLRSLNLSNNKIMGTSLLKPVPKCAQELQRLRVLDISCNSLRCLEPVTRLVGLENLNASSNQVERIAPGFQRMRTLRCICLNNNQLRVLGDVARLRHCSRYAMVTLASF